MPLRDSIFHPFSVSFTGFCVNCRKDQTWKVQFSNTPTRTTHDTYNSWQQVWLSKIVPFQSLQSSSQTPRMIDAAAIEKMKKGVIIVTWPWKAGCYYMLCFQCFSILASFFWCSNCMIPRNSQLFFVRNQGEHLQRRSHRQWSLNRGFASRPDPKKGWGVATFVTICSYFKLLSCAILLDICQVISCGSWVQKFPLYWYDGSKIWLKDGRLWKMRVYQGIARSWNTNQKKKDRKQRTSSACRGSEPHSHVEPPNLSCHSCYSLFHSYTYEYIQLQDDTCI